MFVRYVNCMERRLVSPQVKVTQRTHATCTQKRLYGVFEPMRPAACEMLMTFSNCVKEFEYGKAGGKIIP